MKMLTAGLLIALSITPAYAHRKPRHQPKVTWFNYRVLLPSRENLLSQDTMIDGLGLPRIKNDTELRALIADGALVPITSNQYVRVNPQLDAKRRYCRPWVDVFLQDLGRDYYAQFSAPIRVNSAVRTVQVQLRLLRWNRNAAPAHGQLESAHLAGVAVDLQRRGLSRAQIQFIQQRLLYLSNLGMVICEEELGQQPCFHIVVTGEYPVPPTI
jgi:hypothetical protein